MLRNWKDLSILHIGLERCIQHVLSTRVVVRPYADILFFENESGSRPTPSVAHNAKELQVRTNFVNYVHVTMVVRATKGHIPIKPKSIPDGHTAVLRDVMR